MFSRLNRCFLVCLWTLVACQSSGLPVYAPSHLQLKQLQPASAAQRLQTQSQSQLPRVQLGLEELAFDYHQVLLLQATGPEQRHPDLLHVGQYQLLRDHLLASAPDSFDLAAYYSLANLYHLAGETQQGLDIYTELERHRHSLNWNSMNDYAFYTNRGLLQASLGSDQQALLDYARAILLEPGAAPARINRLALYLRRGDFQSAQQDLERLAPQTVPGHYLHYLHGLMHLLQAQPARAEPELAQAIALQSDFFPAYYVRGCAWFQQAEWEQAILDFSRVLALHPEHTPALANRGHAYSNKGEYTLALADYDKFLTFSSASGAFYYARGNALFYLRRYREAIRDYEIALEQIPEDARLIFNLASAYGSLGDYPAAILLYDRYLQQAPQDLDALNNQAMSFFYLGQLAQARDNYTQVIELSPSSARAWYNRGSAHSLLRDYVASAADYRQYLKLEPQDGQGWFNLGLLTEHAEACESAQQYLDQACVLGFAQACERPVCVPQDTLEESERIES